MNNIFGTDFLPRINVGEWFADLVAWINTHLQALLQFIDWLLKDALYDNLVDSFNWVPALVMALASIFHQGLVDTGR